jgi:dienelactone hydrolase
MNAPEALKPGIYGAVIGAVFVGVVGFSWGGWVTSRTANERAMAMSRTDVVASMVPVCLDIAPSDPARADTLATIRAASTYQRRDALIAAGWATMPGTDGPDRDIAQACLAALDVDGSQERAESADDEG